MKKTISGRSLHTVEPGRSDKSSGSGSSGTGGRTNWRELAAKAFHEEHTTEGRIRFPKQNNPHDD
jgi:hypothetical protein